MFHNIPPQISQRMRQLEALDALDRSDGTPRMERLRQISAETGRTLALFAATAPPGRMIEIGTSAGYSALWLSLACSQMQRKLTTFEILPRKIALARQTFEIAGVEEIVELIEDDALNHLSDMEQIAFCFLDGEKEVYDSCYRAVMPRLVEGGWLIADNALSHGEYLSPLISYALADRRSDTVVLPVGKGLLICRRNHTEAY